MEFAFFRDCIQANQRSMILRDVLGAAGQRLATSY
jgi:hypothetical protein